MMYVYVVYIEDATDNVTVIKLRYSGTKNDYRVVRLSVATTSNHTKSHTKNDTMGRFIVVSIGGIKIIV
jgi:hypothetical protein